MITSVEQTQDNQHHIPGVEFKIIKSHPDDRGFFRELIRKTDSFFSTPAGEPFAQWSHSKMGKNTVKAWHFHHRQVDWWYVPIGVIHVALIDFRKESPSFGKKIEFCLGDPDIQEHALVAVVRIPQGVLHGCRVLTDTAHLFYITSQTYDPQDEGRYPFNSQEVPHSWGNDAELVVAPNDRRLFIPPHSRTVFVESA